MEELHGIKIPELSFNPKLMGHLIYHEGPLLSHFIDKENANDNYIFKWADSDDEVNRWLIFHVNNIDLLCFFNQQKSLLDLIQQNNFVSFVDITDNLEYKRIMKCLTDNIPEDYLPAENYFFKENQYEPYAKLLKTQVFYNILSQFVRKNADLNTSETENKQNILSNSINAKNLPLAYG